MTIGTTENFTPSAVERAPIEAVNWYADYAYTGDRAELFSRLFYWENIRPESVEDFQTWRFSARSCSWSKDGQAVMLQVAGRGDRHDCLQMSVGEFHGHFSEVGSREHLEAITTRFSSLVQDIAA